MRVKYSSRSIRELAAIYRYIAADNSFAAAKVLLALYAACDGLEHFPRRGRRGLRPNTRELLIVSPYKIQYKIARGGDVEIVSVWHGAQNRRG